MSLQETAHLEGKTVSLYLLERIWGSRGFWFLAGIAFAFAVSRGFDPIRFFEGRGGSDKSQTDRQLQNFIQASIARGKILDGKK